MKNWIVFDVDDVVCNFRDSLYESFLKLNKDIHWNNWKEYNHVTIYNLSDEKSLHKHMIEHRVLENAILEEHAYTVLQDLKDSGFSIGFLTARGWHPDGEKITQDFINKYNLPVDKLVISGYHKDKKSFHINKFDGGIEYYIDDSIHHIKDFVDSNVNAVLLDRPWNKNSYLDRVFNLNEFKLKIM